MHWTGDRQADANRVDFSRLQQPRVNAPVAAVDVYPQEKENWRRRNVLHIVIELCTSERETTFLDKGDN